jgi:hypothetical protein
MILSRTEFVESKDTAAIIGRLSRDKSFKAAYLESISKILYRSQRGDIKMDLKICKEIFMANPIVFYTIKDFFLLDAMNEKLEIIKASGLIEFWSHQVIDRKNLNVKIYSSREVFTVNQFLGPFQILLCGLSVSLVIFVAEFLKACFTKTQIY